MEYIFNSSLGIRFAPDALVREIINFMQAEPAFQYKITLGTDSQKLAGTSADFVTAIVVHRVGRGGRYFWRRIEQDNFHTLRNRIIQEVLISLEVAQNFLNHFKNAERENRAIPQYDFEIHVDVGENGETRAMIQELVGMVRAHNFEARTKPLSYAASNIADRHT